MGRKILVALPPAILEQVDHVAKVESRTRSDLVREALRRYLFAFQKDRSPSVKEAVLDFAAPVQMQLPLSAS